MAHGCAVYLHGARRYGTHTHSFLTRPPHTRYPAYIGQLNTHPGLYHALLRAMQRDDDVRSRPHAPHDVLSEEGLLVAAMLRRDFEKHGIHLAETAREDLVHLTVAASHVGMQVLTCCCSVVCGHSV